MELALNDKKENITSLELLEKINQFRERVEGKSELQHKTLLEIIRDEFEEEIGEQKILPSSYRNSQNKEQPMFILTFSQAKQVLVRESKKVRKMVIEYIEKLENALRDKQKLTPAQQLLAHAQVIVELENRINEQEANIKRLEHNQRRLINNNHFTVIAYANLNGIHASTYKAQVIGKRAKKLCVERGLATGTIVDSKYGHINTYPTDILDEVFFKR
ncbi:hypothetical protein [Streptobacillus moniliformis]|uniref:hypothetical protein n=1 Tax=Streptobacillus moniliformis TaxID=34105 RepID=UPI0007E35CB2|nr:hypothetical protein [Streptobacillus moniliformis]